MDSKKNKIHVDLVEAVQVVKDAIESAISDIKMAAKIAYENQLYEVLRHEVFEYKSESQEFAAHV